jgi:hypothetical protein
MPPQILFVGGTFDTTGGRPSGYFGKLVSAVAARLPDSRSTVLNGGSFETLQAAVDAMQEVTHLFWFADVPNELPKLLPTLNTKYPGLVLVGSKNNRKKLYDREALYGRMRASHSELLVEFGDGPDGRLVASLLRAGATVSLESSSNIENVAAALVGELKRLQQLHFPLAKRPITTSDSNSFKVRDFDFETEIPFVPHVGAFGVQRRHHIHEGVDLYGNDGDLVVAMEDGIVRAVLPFTGEAMGSPWWKDTFCVMVEGASGVINYGEIHPGPGIAPRVPVRAGQILGELLTVLREDKGRPMTMLHIERYTAGTDAPLREWSLGIDQPAKLRDPTVLLVQAARTTLPETGSL